MGVSLARFSLPSDLRDPRGMFPEPKEVRDGEGFRGYLESWLQDKLSCDRTEEGFGGQVSKEGPPVASPSQSGLGKLQWQTSGET